MAQAPLKSSTSEDAESSTAAVFPRNDDLMSIALRSDGYIELDDIVRLNRASSPFHDGPSTLGTLTTTVFSSHKDSRGTKPTSAGTSYPIGKGKAVATYASSLSATHGSISEAEAGKDHAFVGIGDWTAGDGPNARPLRGLAKTRKQPQTGRHKKPAVVIHHDDPFPASSEDECPTAETIPRRNSRETKYLRHRTTTTPHDRFVLAEEGRAVHCFENPKAAPQPLSRTRLYTLVALVATTVLTFAFSTFAAHHTGKARIAYTKVIIFSATVLISLFTVAAMVVARRSPQEALLAGLLEFSIGSVLVAQIREFM